MEEHHRDHYNRYHNRYRRQSNRSTRHRRRRQKGPFRIRIDRAINWRCLRLNSTIYTVFARCGSYSRLWVVILVMVANGGVGIRGVWLTAVTDTRHWRGVGIITGLGLCMRIKWGHSTSETRAIVRGCVLFNKRH